MMRTPVRRPSDRRFPAVAAALIAILISAGILIGCGEGERIPVIPVIASLDMAPDPFFIPLAPLCGDQIQQDAVWLTDDRAYIVGTAGLVLGRSPDQHWTREHSGTDADLLIVAATDKGEVLASRAGA